MPTLTRNITKVTATPQSVRDANLPGAFKGLKIIDSDTHFNGSPSFWVDNAPAALKSRVPQMVTVDGKSVWMLDGKQIGQYGAVVIDRDGGKLRGKMSWEDVSEGHPGAIDMTARLEMMDREGVYAQIAFTNGVPADLGPQSSTDDVDLRLECMKLYNSYLAHEQTASGNRVFPMAILPVWDIKQAVREIERLTDMGIVGFSVQDHPEKHYDVPGYLHADWQPFWEAMDSTGAVLNFHLGGGGVFNAFDAPWVEFGFERNLAITASLFFMTNGISLSNFVMSGIFDRYPNLKMVSTEGGVGWIPFLLESLEYQMDEMVVSERAMAKRRPTEYFKDHVYGCFWFERHGLKSFVEALGDRNLLVETDFPHPTCLWPSPMQYLAESVKQAGWSEQTIRRAFQDNAAELYGIEV
jgi:predicted TIM-barrel fold metal-dependent hydrolase